MIHNNYNTDKQWFKREYDYVEVKKNYLNNKEFKPVSPYISFNKHLNISRQEQSYIMKLLKELYLSNDSFKSLSSLYDNIYVVKNLHQNGHFNIILVNPRLNKRSETLHVLVEKDKIIRITQVITLI